MSNWISLSGAKGPRYSQSLLSWDSQMIAGDMGIPFLNPRWGEQDGLMILWALCLAPGGWWSNSAWGNHGETSEENSICIWCWRIIFFSEVERRDVKEHSRGENSTSKGTEVWRCFWGQKAAPKTLSSGLAGSSPDQLFLALLEY